MWTVAAGLVDKSTGGSNLGAMLTWHILTATRNDAGLQTEFLNELRDVLTGSGRVDECRLYIVDDFSIDDTVTSVQRWSEANPELAVEILQVPSNMGNQGAMSFALHSCDVPPDGFLLSLDSDGEDDLQRIPEFMELAEQQPSHVLFTERGRRHDRIMVRVLYRAFRALFKWLTNARVMPNNYMILPGRYLNAVRLSPFTGVYYSLAVLRLGLPYNTVSCDRRPRYGGQSSQSLYGLTSHAFVGMMMFFETVIAKLFMVLLTAVGCFGGLSAFALFIKVYREAQLPGWTAMFMAVNFGFVVFLLAMLLVMAALAFLFKVMNYEILTRELRR